MRIPKKLMPHTVQVAAYQGTGTYGETWDTPYSIRRAYCEDKQQAVVNELGEQETSTGFVIVDPEWQVPIKSRVTVWPGQPNQRTGRVVAVSRLQHPSAPSHQVLYLGGA